mmetsp:Transcript_17012/g.26249  ORF Transcript_17012/g.26249 Transcript_17012/m.26249 type:complete len:210 (+) Transcript_17012:897-1526(+)
MLATLWVSVPLGEAEVDSKHIMLSLSNSDEKVIRFDISMEVEPAVDVLYPLDHLVSEHQHCFQGEFTAAFPKELFEAGTKHVHYHTVPLFVLAEVVYFWNSDPVTKDLVDFLFVIQLALVQGHRLLLCYAVFLVFLAGVHQILDLHGEHKLINTRCRDRRRSCSCTFGNGLPLSHNVQARPNFSEATRAELLLAEIPAPNIFLMVSGLI